MSVHNKKPTLALMLGAGLLAASAFAQTPPPQNVNPNRHENLAHAQRAIDNAFNALSAAQQANEFDMGGHAARAKELLEQADAEIKQAARDANHSRP